MDIATALDSLKARADVLTEQNRNDLDDKGYTVFPGIIDDEWAVHEVRTTADFAPTNWLATFYMGDLNFQVVHHLFTKMSHVHYPDIQSIVMETCEEYGVPYTCYHSVWKAAVVHVRFLIALGQRSGPTAIPCTTLETSADSG